MKRAVGWWCVVLIGSIQCFFFFWLTSCFYSFIELQLWKKHKNLDVKLVFTTWWTEKQAATFACAAKLCPHAVILVSMVLSNTLKMFFLCCKFNSSDSKITLFKLQLCNKSPISIVCGRRTTFKNQQLVLGTAAHWCCVCACVFVCHAGRRNKWSPAVATASACFCSALAGLDGPPWLRFMVLI